MRSESPARGLVTNPRRSSLGGRLADDSRLRLLGRLLVVVIATLAFSGDWLGTSSAYGSGLPDGRVYEQVSPVNKNGNYVASGGATIVTGGEGYAAASADGNALAFLGSGAMGDAASSVLGPYVSRRSAGGWATTSATPGQLGVTSLFGSPLILIPSQDFSRFVFGSVNAGTAYSPEEPSGPFHSLDLYLSEDAFAPPAWLGKPAIPDPLPRPGANETNELNFDYGVAGATPSLSTVYFAYSGTLIAQDASRAPNVGDGSGQHPGTDPWGFYEWTAGTLSSAGVLPDGSVSPFGAVPADVAANLHFGGGEWQAMDFNNEVSLDGTRAFFVSPDPIASTVTSGRCASEGPCTTAPPELYVRKTAADGSKSTALVSQSQLPGHLGEPAPHGPVGVVDAPILGAARDSTYVYAAPDGSQAFFASEDRLTGAAPGGPGPKEYDYAVGADTLTYMPGVVGPIVAASQDGSRILFENTASTPKELEMWSAGPGGGSVTPVAELPPATETGPPFNGSVGVEARASTGGSAFVFDTNAPIPGGFNNQEGFGEIYRYDVASETINCVSCPPDGVAPTSAATISYDNGGGNDARPRSTVDTRVISSDASRVFFDTADPLVPQDSNGKRDVYEWEVEGAGSCAESPGCIYLISSGKSSEDSFYLDNSESGNDVFFSTVDGLAAADADGAYDVYDARVPRPGDSQPPAPAPCQGEECRAVPPVSGIAGPPASTTLNGTGNLSPPLTKPLPKKSPPRLTNAQKLALALKVCGKKHGHARRSCEAAARKRYGPRHKKAGVKSKQPSRRTR